MKKFIKQDIKGSSSMIVIKQIIEETDKNGHQISDNLLGQMMKKLHLYNENVGYGSFANTLAMDEHFKENYSMSNDYRDSWLGKEQTVHIFRKGKSVDDDEYYVGSIKYVSYNNLLNKLKNIFKSFGGLKNNSVITK